MYTQFRPQAVTPPLPYHIQQYCASISVVAQALRDFKTFASHINQHFAVMFQEVVNSLPRWHRTLLLQNTDFSTLKRRLRILPLLRDNCTGLSAIDTYRAIMEVLRTFIFNLVNVEPVKATTHTLRNTVTARTNK